MTWTLVGTVLGLSLLYASTRKVDFAALTTTLRLVEWVWVAAILGATIGFIAIKALRWGMLLRFVPGLTFQDLHASVYVGLAANFLVSHLGEFVRATIIAGQRQVAVSTIFASIMVERALDFIALLLLLALVLFTSPDLPRIVAVAAAVAGAIVIIAMTGLLLLLNPPAWLERLVRALTRRVRERLRDRALQLFERSRQGLAAITSLRLMMLAIAASVAQWSLVVVAIFCSGMAIGAPMSLAAAIVTFVLIVMGLTLPNSPMQIGTTQLAFAVGLGTDGVQATTSIAASLIYTAFLIIPIMIVGGILMLRIRPTTK